MSMSDFFTRAKANKGIKVPLFAPDGTETDHWLVIRSVDSDEYRKALIETKRELMRDSADKGKVDEEVVEDLTTKQIVALIAEWSFDEELTVDNAVKFLKEAPQIADQIDKIGVNRRLFYASERNSSLSSQEQK